MTSGGHFRHYTKLLFLFPVERIKCESCTEIFTAPTFYIKHHQSVHGRLPPGYEDTKLLFCDQCTQVFITETSLKLHNSKVNYIS